MHIQNLRLKKRELKVESHKIQKSWTSKCKFICYIIYLELWCKIALPSGYPSNLLLAFLYYLFCVFSLSAKADDNFETNKSDDKKERNKQQFKWKAHRTTQVISHKISILRHKIMSNTCVMCIYMFMFTWLFIVFLFLVGSRHTDFHIPFGCFFFSFPVRTSGNAAKPFGFNINLCCVF